MIVAAEFIRCELMTANVGSQSSLRRRAPRPGRSVECPVRDTGHGA